MTSAPQRSGTGGTPPPLHRADHWRTDASLSAAILVTQPIGYRHASSDRHVPPVGSFVPILLGAFHDPHPCRPSSSPSRTVSQCQEESHHHPFLTRRPYRGPARSSVARRARPRIHVALVIHMRSLSPHNLPSSASAGQRHPQPYGAQTKWLLQGHLQTMISRTGAHPFR